MAPLDDLIQDVYGNVFTSLCWMACTVSQMLLRTDGVRYRTDFCSPPIVQHTKRNSKCLIAIFAPQQCLRTVHVSTRWYDGTLICHLFDEGILRSI